jgi:hypothetical protein
LSTVAQPSIAFNGLRSSCESVARNSSLIWLLRSASVARGAFAGQQPFAFGDVRGDGDARSVAVLGHDAPLRLRDAAVGTQDGHGAFPVDRRLLSASCSVLHKSCFAGSMRSTQPLPMMSFARAGDAAELGIHVLVDESGIQQRDTARGEFEHGSKTRIGRATNDVGPGARTAVREPWR